MKKILTIDKIQVNGNATHFWFQDKDIKEIAITLNGYHLLCPYIKLLRLIANADITDEMFTNGLRGKKVLWECYSKQWELVKFIDD